VFDSGVNLALANIQLALQILQRLAALGEILFVLGQCGGAFVRLALNLARSAAISGWARVSVSGNSTLQLGQVIVVSYNMAASFGFGWGCLLRRTRRVADNNVELYSGL